MSPLLAYLTKTASPAAALRRARNVTHTHPTPAQASAGNYRCGRFSLHGLAIKIENPKGTERKGYDSEGNVTWKRVMHADYGSFPKSMAVDGDQVDVFVGPDLDSHFVAVVDQMKADGSFDESKVILATKNQEQAERLYAAHYPRSWKLGPVSTTTVSQLREWLRNGDTHAPFKGQLIKAAALRPIAERMQRLRDRRGECYVCAKPNRDGLVCDCGETKPWERDEVIKSANRFAELWRAGKLSRSAVQAATGVATAAAKPRQGHKIADALGAMRNARGPVADMGKWGPASEVYAGNVAADVNRRVAGLSGVSPSKIDVTAGFTSERPAWLDSGRTTPTRRLRNLPEPSASPWRNYQNVWDTSRLGPSYDEADNVLRKAKPNSPEMRHELGHWKQTLLNYNDPVKLHTDTRRMLRSVGQADPKFRETITARTSKTKGNTFVSELQAQMYGASGKGGEALRNATAVDKSTRGVAQMLPTDEVSFYRKLRRSQDSALAPVRAAPADPVTRSVLEHLVRNYLMKLSP